MRTELSARSLYITPCNCWAAKNGTHASQQVSAAPSCQQTSPEDYITAFLGHGSFIFMSSTISARSLAAGDAIFLAFVSCAPLLVDKARCSRGKGCTGADGTPTTSAKTKRRVSCEIAADYILNTVIDRQSKHHNPECDTPVCASDL